MNPKYDETPDGLICSFEDVIPRVKTNHLWSIATETAQKLVESTLPGHIVGAALKIPTAATKALYTGATCIENRADQLLTRGLDVRDVQYTFLHNLNDLKSGGPPAWRSAYHFLRRYPDSACGRKLILMMRAANERLDTDFHGAVAFYAQQGKELAEADDRLAIECVTARGDATGTS